MARANTRTLLSLDRFAEIMNFNPLHFNQIFVRDLSEPATCDVPLYQYSWQMADRVGREEIADAIYNAEALLTQHLGFSPMPEYVEDDNVSVVRPYNTVLGNSLLDVRGALNTVRASRGYIIRGGREALSLIAEHIGIGYNDSNNDGYKETAAIVTAVSVPAEEIAVYYPGKNGDPAWEIRPIKASIEGGIATIEFGRHQAVIESRLEELQPSGVDGQDDNNFLTTVDIYRKYTNPEIQAQLVWHNVGTCQQCYACTHGLQNGCLSVIDHRQALVNVQPGNYNVDDSTWTFAFYAACRPPDALTLNYLAGWRNPRTFERAIAYLALSFLNRPLCKCQPVENMLRHWTTNLAQRTADSRGSVGFQVPTRNLYNPLGTTMGAYFAWNLISDYMIGQAAPNA